MALRTRLIAIAFAGLTVATAVHAQEDGTVRLLRVEATASGARVVLSGALEVPRYAVRSRDEGRVVVLEVAGAEPAADGMTVRGSAPLIERTTSSQTDRGLRLELGLRAEVNHRVEASPGQIVLLLDRVGAPSPHGAGGGEVLTVSGVHVEQRDGRDRVVVQLSGPGEFRVRERPGEASRLFIADATLEGGVDQSLRVDDRRMGAVRGVEVRQDERRVVVEVDRDRRARGTAIREGDRIVWLFTVPRATTGRPAARTVARDPDLFAEDAGDGAAETEVVSEEVAAFLTDVPLQIGRARDDRRYRGRRIDLDFHNADIHNILRLIAEVGGVNIVTSDDVEGTITIRMRNVPWDQALDVILQAKGLGMVRRGNLIRVAPLEALEKEREAAIARQKQQIQLAPLETRLIPVSYATADELSPRVQ
ncbi:MAG: secretin and TonB N-terminal domain-containing protein [Sandaracinaceae bacterium]